MTPPYKKYNFSTTTDILQELYTIFLLKTRQTNTLKCSYKDTLAYFFIIFDINASFQ